MLFESYEHPDALFIIDYLDVLQASKMLMPNAESLEHQDKFIRENYKYNVIVQLELSCVNGLSAVEQKSTGTNSEAAKIDENQ